MSCAQGQWHLISELLWSKRLEKSREWLLILDKKHYGISEIALLTGFKSAAHFTRMFRESYGLAPSEFRRKVGVEFSVNN
ncbi:helix-turn-helix domain-containing protein [Pseudomonas brenneri]|uniref:helix-turn-helix domain-containing protein n=1 Tax=Pseudomonas brenneri TaxID=129817 RepID=UPI003BA304E7